MTKAISVIKQQDLTLLTESGLLSVEHQQALTTASAAIPALRDASTPVGERRFARADSVLAVRSNSPVDQARDVLSALDKLWSGASGEFHRLRQIHFDIKLRQVKADRAKKQLAKAGMDDQPVIEAEIALAEAEIDALIAQVTQGQEKLQGVITKAVAHSQRYTALCTTAGVASFTADDFMKDEINYLIKTAFWHAGQTFRIVDGRNAKERAKDEGMNEFERRSKAREYAAPRVDLNTGTWFEALGITKAEVAAELRGVEEEKYQLTQANREWPWPPDFFPYFEAWLSRMVVKYADRVMAAVKQHGPDRLKRLQSIITPTENDAGKQTGAEVERGSMFES